MIQDNVSQGNKGGYINMKKCVSCGADLSEDAKFCVKCGTKVEEVKAEAVKEEAPKQEEKKEEAPVQPEPTPQVAPVQPEPTPVQAAPAYNNQYNANQNYNNNPYDNRYYAANPFDHTNEFDAKDISDNKVIAMLVYLLGIVGVFLALIGSQNSPYAAFHVRQSLKFTVIETLMAIITALLSWTFIVPIAAGIMYIVLFVVKIICFVSICKGEAKEPAIIRSFGFLR